MCGFVGQFNTNNQKIKEAGKKILHRGPDMQNFSAGEDWSIAFNRLSIIDLSNEGMQPFSYDGAKVFLNGEIYNFLELKEKYSSEFKCKTNSDVEIVPFLYRKYGIDFLNYINGMFSIVIIDEKLNKKFLIRDRYGKKPLFYIKEKEGLYFTSEIKALKDIVKLNYDKTNLSIYFHSGLLPQPLTSYKNLFSINPGSYLILDDKKISESKWYKPKIFIKKQKFQIIKNNFLSYFKKSIDLRLRSDVPIGVFLSGGLDSCAIMEMINKNKGNITALICTIPGKEKFSGVKTDTDIPKKICKEYGYKFIETVFDYNYFNKNLIKIIHSFDEFVPDNGCLIFFALAETAKKNNIKVIMSGTGGDEIFGGYPWQNKIRFIPNFLLNKFLNYKEKIYKNHLPKSIFNINNFFLRKIIKAYQLFFHTRIWHSETFGSGLGDLMDDTKSESFERLNSYSESYFDYTNKVFNKSDYNHINFANIFTTINFQNHFLDIACMSHSVENRSPLLDFNIFEYMMSVPDKYKNRSGIKSIFRKILRNRLPNYVTSAKKSGTTLPLNVWINERKFLKKDIDNFITRNLFYLKDYLSVDLYENLKKNSTAILKNDYIKIFKLISFIVWIKINVEKSIKDYSITFEDLLKL